MYVEVIEKYIVGLKDEKPSLNNWKREASVRSGTIVSEVML